jgi:hypothetical protein
LLSDLDRIAVLLIERGHTQLLDYPWSLYLAALDKARKKG